MTKVFISYSHVDSSIAEEVSQLLDELYIEHFRDVKDIDLGESITARVREGVNDSTMLLVIISPASLKSHWVPYEIGHASALGKIIIPFFTHPSLDVPHYISDLSCATRIDQLREYFLKRFSKDSTQAKVQAPVKNPIPVNNPTHSNSRTGLTIVEEKILKALANDYFGRKEDISRRLGMTYANLDIFVNSLQEKGHINEYQLGNEEYVKITPEGTRLTLSLLDNSALPRLSEEVTNAEIAILKALANDHFSSKEEILKRLGLTRARLDYCVISLKDMGLISEYERGNVENIMITHEGIGFLLSNHYGNE